MKRKIAMLVVGASAVAHADVVWNEFDHGDLSGDPDAPTPLVFGLGGNTIIGSVLGPDDTRDYITFTVPQGMALTALLQHQWEDLDTGGPGNTGFHAINAGGTSYIPDQDTIGLFLGADHMNPEASGTDLLPNLAAGNFGSMGFDIPLGPGTYSYLVQQTGEDNSGYTLELVLTPAPGALVLLGLCGLGLARRER